MKGPINPRLGVWRGWGMLAAIFVGFALRADFAAEFTAANRLYEEGKFPAAAAAYERILGSGKTSVALYFNLGNAWLKAQRIGLAVASYRQALALSPRDHDVWANLALARSRLARPPAPESSANAVFGRLRPIECLGAAAVAVWLFTGMLLVTRLKSSLRERMRPVLAAAGTVCAAVVALAFLALALQSRQPDAVIILKEAQVRFGPLEESKEAFTLPEGSEVRVLQTQGDWVLVEAPGQVRTGWIRLEHLRRIDTG